MQESAGDHRVIPELTPLAGRERYVPLDVLRGIALLGVLWVNLLTSFRVSLFEHLLNFHTHPGALNEWIDLVTAWLVLTDHTNETETEKKYGMAVLAWKEQLRVE